MTCQLVRWAGWCYLVGGLGLPAAAQGPGPRLVLDRGMVGARYQYIDNAGTTLADHLQHQLVAGGRLVSGGPVTVGLRGRLASGNGFRSGWNSTGVGNTRAVWEPYLKELALVLASPGGLRAEVGGLAPERGGISEVTGFDNDGYLVGAQIQIGPEAGWPLSRLVVTAGDLGDLARSAVFPRLRRFGRVSYGQLLVSKEVGRGGFTAEYTFRDGVSSFHGAARIEGRTGRWALRGEGFVRTSDASGLAVVAELIPGRRVQLEVGYVKADAPILNGDRYGPGERLFATLAYAVMPSLDLSTTAVHRVRGALGFERRLDLMAVYDWRAGLGVRHP